MPVILVVKVISAVGLPVMDKTSNLTDAFVEIKFGDKNFKTEVRWKCLNPVFNSEDFFFEVSDEEVACESLHIKMMDYDTYSANDAIGKVSMSLLPFMTIGGNNELSGWLPLFDTMHGNRGYINLVIKVNKIGDIMPNQCNVIGFPIFTLNSIPYQNNLDVNYGLVSDILVVNDTEDDWIDMIRPSRTSNEARQRVFRNLSTEMICILVNKCISIGGNTLLGLRVYFDIEGNSGIVCRGYGTCVSLSKDKRSRRSLKNEEQFHDNSCSLSTSTLRMINPSVECAVLNIPISTLKYLPSLFAYRIGGTVTAVSVRSLHLYDKNTPRAQIVHWWNELRLELKRQAYVLNCNIIEGYCESVSINGKHFVMFAHGTAIMKSTKNSEDSGCSYYHLSYNLEDSPYNMKYELCNGCRKETVPEYIISTIKMPNCNKNIKGQFLQVCAYRSRKGDDVANGNQDLLFSTYILHKKLIKKLKKLGLNALFDLSIDVCFSDDAIICSGTGTGYALSYLPCSSTTVQPSPVFTLCTNSQISYFAKMNNLIDENESNLIVDTNIADECLNRSLNSNQKRNSHSKRAIYRSFVISLCKIVKLMDMRNDMLSDSSIVLQTDKESQNYNIKALRNEFSGMLEYLSFKVSRQKHMALSDIRMQITQDDNLFFLDLFASGHISLRSESTGDNKNSSKIVSKEISGRKNLNHELYHSENDIFVSSSFDVESESIRYLGLLNLIYIREVNDIKKGSERDLISFQNSFKNDMLDVVKLHAKAMGANCILGYEIAESRMYYSFHKTDAYCIYSVIGNMAKIS